MTRDDSAEDASTTFFRLAWVGDDARNPHTFGDKYPTLLAARQAAPEVNKQRKAAGLHRCNCVVQLKRREKKQVHLGRYETAARFPLVEKTKK